MKSIGVFLLELFAQTIRLIAFACACVEDSARFTWNVFQSERQRVLRRLNSGELRERKHAATTTPKGEKAITERQAQHILHESWEAEENDDFKR